MSQNCLEAAQSASFVCLWPCLPSSPARTFQARLSSAPAPLRASAWLETVCWDRPGAGCGGWSRRQQRPGLGGTEATGDRRVQPASSLQLRRSGQNPQKVLEGAAGSLPSPAPPGDDLPWSGAGWTAGGPRVWARRTQGCGVPGSSTGNTQGLRPGGLPKVLALPRPLTWCSVNPCPRSRFLPTFRPRQGSSPQACDTPHRAAQEARL